MRISLIVSSYNRPDYLACFLAALERQRRAPDELVIADDGSSPEAWARIQALARMASVPVTPVTQEDRGFRLAAARNLGVRAAGGDYLIFSDSDMLPGPEFVEVHERHARKGRFLIGNRGDLDRELTDRIVADPANAPAFEQLWAAARRGHIATSQRRFLRQSLQRKLGLATAHKPQILGGHFSLWRAALEAVNGFDERFEGWGYEDDDLSLRLYRAGYTSRSVMRQARALHLWHPGAQGSDRRETSPNRLYFRRPRQSAWCEKGLVHCHPME